MKKLVLIFTVLLFSRATNAQTEIFVAPLFLSGLEIYSDMFLWKYGNGLKNGFGFNVTLGTIGFQKDNKKRFNISASSSSIYSGDYLDNYLIGQGYNPSNIESTNSRSEAIQAIYRLELEYKRIIPWEQKIIGFNVLSLIGYGVNIYKYDLDRDFANYFVKTAKTVERYTMYNHLPVGAEIGMLADFEIRETVQWFGISCNMALATYLQLPKLQGLLIEEYHQMHLQKKLSFL